MIDYASLGFTSFDEYYIYFMHNLLPSNRTYDYFVDWRKVRNAIERKREEIFLLNSLRECQNPNEMKERMVSLLKRYPSVLEAIPLLIAERAKKGVIDVYDPEQSIFIQYHFSRKSRVHENNYEKIAFFCEKTGILDLISKTKDLHDYLLGVEVGLDTNARKNRSGDIFQRMVTTLLKKELPSGVRLVEQDSELSLYDVVGEARTEKAKTHDIILYISNKAMFVLEVNFYNTSGSKPTSIAESYMKMSEKAETRGLKFVWVTDGPAWRKMQEPLLRAMKDSKITFVLNYDLITKFKKIVSEQASTIS